MPIAAQRGILTRKEGRGVEMRGPSSTAFEPAGSDDISLHILVLNGLLWKGPKMKKKEFSTAYNNEARAHQR